MTDFKALLVPDRGQPARAIHLVDAAGHDDWLKHQPPRHRAAIAAQGFSPSAGSIAILPGDAAEAWSVVAFVADAARLTPWCLARLAERLPADSYRVEGVEPGAGMLGWLLAQHRFERYRKVEGTGPRVLLTGEPGRIEAVVREAAATARVRDLVDTGASDLGPAELAVVAASVGEAHGARLTVTEGRELERGFPMIHIVGAAASRQRAPRLIELDWGRDDHPRVAIVGKGVCFDSGGLDLKPSAGMRLMKKDMGGAAHALALAELVMAARLPVRLHMLIPAVENAVGSDAFRPGDVLRTRAGLTVENTNTDAEGRLILADALTRAGEERPELILDFATLTGAARVALGPDLPPLFTDDERLAADLIAAGQALHDPIWRLPMWDGYDEMLKSEIADLVNAAEGAFAGAITAALFLRRFAPKGTAWAHLDVFAWRPVARPGRPKGGDAFGVRAAFAMLSARYGA